MPRRWLILGLWAASVAVIGCQGSTPPANQAADEDGAVAENSDGKAAGGENSLAKAPFPVLEGVDSFEGTWLLAPSIERASRVFWLFRLAHDEDGKWTMTDLANEPTLGTVTGTKVEIDGNQIHLQGELANPKAQVKHAPFDFRGTLTDGVVWGNLLIADAPAPMPARLFPTDADSLSEYADGIPEAGHAEFQKAANEPDPAHNLWKVAKEYPQSPLAVDVYRALFTEIGKWKLTEEEVLAAEKDFRQAAGRWGPRFQAAAEIDAGLGLASARKFIDVADEFLNDAEKRLPERSELLNAKLKAGRIHVRIARGLSALQGEDKAAAAAADEDLKALLSDQPYHPEVLYALAEYAENHDRIDEAIDDYKLLVALPSLESMAVGSRLATPAPDQMPRAALERLWKDKHESSDGLPAALAETYDRETAAVLDKIREGSSELPAADAGNRTLLVELFTGTSCAPCVAVDLALEGLMRDLPQSEAVLLSYHQHIPGPDPLASLDAEGRAKYYNVEGTPSLFMNGAPIERIGGVFLPSFIEQNYRTLHPAFEFFLKQPADVTIESKADAAEGKLNVHVTASGVPEDILDKVRLRLALAEEDVDYIAPNGVRHHHMVVRMMLGTPSGKKATKDGVLEFKIAMPLANIKAQQVAYLAQYEHGKRMSFPDKPVELKPLHLVAFVQNDATHEVLQAASIPVTGDLEYPNFEVGPNGQLQLVPAESNPAESEPAASEETEQPADAAPEK